MKPFFSEEMGFNELNELEKQLNYRIDVQDMRKSSYVARHGGIWKSIDAS